MKSNPFLSLLVRSSKYDKWTPFTDFGDFYLIQTVVNKMNTKL